MGAERARGMSTNPAARPKGSAGLSISATLIVATSLVVAVAVGVVALFADRTGRALTATQIHDRREAGERAIARASELVVKAVAAAVALPLANHAYPDLEPVLDDAIAEDRRSGDNRVRWLVLLGDDGGVVARTAGAPDAAALATIRSQLVAGVRANGVVRARHDAEWVYSADVRLAGSTLGALRMGVSTAELERELARSLDAAVATARSARTRTLLVALAVLALGVALAALQGVRLARPIKALTAQAERIAGGDLQSRVEVARRDELGVLGRAFNAMSEQIRVLLVEQGQRVALEREMALARQVQQAMLPPDTLDAHGALKIVGSCLPASTCGGDWWTYRKLSGDRLLVVLGDATGHGLHSAMIAATARGAVEALAAVDEALLTPAQVLRAIDSGIRQLDETNVLMTAFAAVFDATTGAVTYANAAQNFPYVLRLDDARVLGQPSIVAAAGNPLGDRTIALEIRRGALQLAPGDLFVCFTDGMVERADRAGELFGDRRLRKALIGATLDDGASLVALRDRLLAEVARHAAGVDAEDDVTLVLCQYDPPQATRQGAA